MLALREFRRYRGLGMSGAGGTLGRFRVVTFYQSVWKYFDILKTGTCSRSGAEQLNSSLVWR